MKKLLISVWLCCSFQLLIAQNADSQKPVKVGDEYQGGIVFFVDYSGEHGLIAAPYDQTTEKVWWGPNSNTIALSPTNGQSNTKKIVEFFQAEPLKTPTAAYICDTLSLGGYTDWYLPAIEELEQMYYERNTIGNFLIGDYCSSTEMRKEDAYSIHFRPHNRVVFYYNKTNKDYFVRCIRKF